MTKIKKPKAKIGDVVVIKTGVSEFFQFEIIVSYYRLDKWFYCGSRTEIVLGCGYERDIDYRAEFNDKDIIMNLSENN